MSFSNSIELLQFHWMAYTIYSFMIISVIAWFAYNLTKKEKAKAVVRIPFYAYMAFLVAGGVGHHIFTYNTVPWVSEDITRHDITPDQTFKISITKHKFNMPKQKILISCREKVMFDVVSTDLIYGFGLFRKDGSMVTQMQVNPGSPNDLLWTFNHNGVFDLMSTEYSGPAGNAMFIPDAVEVVGCDKIVAMVDGGSK